MSHLLGGAPRERPAERPSDHGKTARTQQHDGLDLTLAESPPPKEIT